MAIDERFNITQLDKHRPTIFAVVNLSRAHVIPKRAFRHMEKLSCFFRAKQLILVEMFLIGGFSVLISCVLMLNILGGHATYFPIVKTILRWASCLVNIVDQSGH